MPQNPAESVNPAPPKTPANPANLAQPKSPVNLDAPRPANPANPAPHANPPASQNHPNHPKTPANPKIITRFAPSPTGFLHIGGLRTALFNYLFAKHHGGQFLLRIEDTDFNRNSLAATEAILEAFAWVGLKHDNAEVVYQSKRLAIYQKYANELLEKGAAYRCYTTKEELDALREAQTKAGLTPRYDNRYRDFTGSPPSGVAPCIRIKAPLEGAVGFSDRLKGEISINAREMDDFVIMRSDGTPTYNFVVAVDDALMSVSDVIRGDDHLTNTPKQLLIYRALGFTPPNFCHIPMILNPQGHKLSKRDGAMNVMDYARLGYLPEALLNFLLRLGFSYEDKEIFSLGEMISLFSLSRLSTSPSAYNESKLLWLNHHYIKECEDSRLFGLVVGAERGESGGESRGESSSESGAARGKNCGESVKNRESCEGESYGKPCGESPAGAFLSALNPAQKAVLFRELKERSATILAFREGCAAIFERPKDRPQGYDEKMLKKLDSTAAARLLEALDFVENWAENGGETANEFGAQENGESCGESRSGAESCGESNAQNPHPSEAQKSRESCAFERRGGESRSAESNLAESCGAFTPESCHAALNAFAARNDLKIGALMLALRCALLGTSGGLGVSEVIFILGLGEARRRVADFGAFHAAMLSGRAR